MKKKRTDATEVTNDNKRPRDLHQLDPEQREQRRKIMTDYDGVVSKLARGFASNFKPATCEWLTKETHILPPVVNIVYTMTLESPQLAGPLDLVRLAQFMPNVKYKPPKSAAITMRVVPVTAILYMVSKLTLIRATTPSMAVYFCHVIRQIIERIPVIMRNADDPEAKSYIGRLEGYLAFSRGILQNIVGSGALPQDGVHLTKLLNAEAESAEWDAAGFPNLIYRNYLPNGRRFCSNIASTGKVVVMGCKSIEDMYEVYKITCDVVHDYDDPDAPTDPKERHKRRMKQLQDDPRFIREEDDVAYVHMDRLGDEYGEADVADVLIGEDGELDMAALMTELIKHEDAPPTGSNAFMQVVKQADTGEPPLFMAVRAAQPANVRFILSDPGMSRDIWIRNPVTGQLVVNEIIDAVPIDTLVGNALEVKYIVDEFIEKHGQLAGTPLSSSGVRQ